MPYANNISAHGQLLSVWFAAAIDHLESPASLIAALPVRVRSLYALSAFFDGYQ